MITFFCGTSAMANFGLDTSAPKGIPPSPFDMKAATKLMALLKTARKVEGSPSLRKWADDIRRLRTSGDGVTEDRIRAAINWYAANLNRPHTPGIFSAASLRGKFAALESAMRIATTEIPPDLAITQTARDINADCGYLTWPQEEGKSLAADMAALNLAVIQRSYDNYAAWWRFITVWGSRAEALWESGRRAETTPLDRLADHLGKFQCTPREFVAGWINEIHHLAYTAPWWPERGRLAKHVWHVRQPIWTYRQERLVEEYLGNPDKWQVILAAFDSGKEMLPKQTVSKEADNDLR